MDPYTHLEDVGLVPEFRSIHVEGAEKNLQSLQYFNSDSLLPLYAEK